MPDVRDQLNPAPAVPPESPGTGGVMPLPQRVPSQTGDDGTTTRGVGTAPSTADRPAGPMKMAWRRFRRHRPGMMGLFALVVLYLVVIFADFIAPYDYTDEA